MTQSGPWEKYQRQQPASGPWSKYQKARQEDDGAVAQPSTAVDILKSGLSGVRQGIEAGIGAFGDVGEAQRGITEWAAQKMGASPEAARSYGQVARRLTGMPWALPTSEIRGVTEPVLGKPYEPETTAGKYARTVGEFVPAAALPSGKAGIAERLVTQALLPGLGSEAAGQLTEGSSLEPFARIAGAIAGGSVPMLARKVITPFPSSVDRSAAADFLAQEGVPLTAGQRTGSRGLRYAESELGGIKASDLMERQGEAFTDAAMRKAGGSGLATPDNLAALKGGLGKQFEDIAGRHTVFADQQLGRDIGTTLNRYDKLLEAQQKPIIAELADDMISRFTANNGKLSGAEYQTIRSDLTQAASSTNNRTLGAALRGLRDALDNAMDRSINPQDAGKWAALRRQYGNYKVLNKASVGAGEEAGRGVISPARLRSAAAAGNQDGFATGVSDFTKLAKAGQTVMSPLPNSGTAARTAVRNLGSPLLAGGGALAGGVPGLLAGLLAPAVAGKALMSSPVQSYLSNQLLGPGGSDTLKRLALQALMGSDLARQKLIGP